MMIIIIAANYSSVSYRVKAYSVMFTLNMLHGTISSVVLWL